MPNLRLRIALDIEFISGVRVSICVNKRLGASAVVEAVESALKHQRDCAPEDSILAMLQQRGLLNFVHGQKIVGWTKPLCEQGIHHRDRLQCVQSSVHSSEEDDSDMPPLIDSSSDSCFRLPKKRDESVHDSSDDEMRMHMKRLTRKLHVEARRKRR